MSDSVLERLARIEATLDLIRESVERSEDHLGVQNGRIRTLEKWQGYIVGGGAVVVFAIPLLIHYFLR